MQQLKQERPAAAGGPSPGDVLVAFGITGDLARQMTLRSLYRLERRGLLDAPVVGVAVDDWTVDRLRRHAREVIAASGEPIDDAVYYLEIPPSLFSTVVGGLSDAHLMDDARVVVEKPFGHDEASARELNE